MLPFFTTIDLKLVTRWPSYSDGQTQGHTFFGVFDQGLAIAAACSAVDQHSNSAQDSVQ